LVSCIVCPGVDGPGLKFLFAPSRVFPLERPLKLPPMSSFWSTLAANTLPPLVDHWFFFFFSPIPGPLVYRLLFPLDDRPYAMNISSICRLPGDGGSLSLRTRSFFPLTFLSCQFPPLFRMSQQREATFLPQKPFCGLFFLGNPPFDCIMTNFDLCLTADPPN